MAVDDDAIELLRQVGIADPTIKSLVKRNLYPTQLPQVKKPVYPNLSVDIQSGEGVGSFRGFRKMKIAVWAYSREDYDEAKKVYEAFADKFNSQRFFDSNVNIILSEIDVPNRFYTAKEKLFFYRGNWNLTASARS